MAYDILMLFPIYHMQLGYFQFYCSHMLFTASKGLPLAHTLIYILMYLSLSWGINPIILLHIYALYSPLGLS